MDKPKLYDFIKKIMGDGKTELEYEEAMDNFEQYLLIVREIAERLNRAGKKIENKDDFIDT